MNCYGKHCEQSCAGLITGATCRLKYDDVKNQRQHCQGRENQCTKFIASTKAPTAVPRHSLVFTGEWPVFRGHNYNHQGKIGNKSSHAPLNRVALGSQVHTTDAFPGLLQHEANRDFQPIDPV